MAVHIMRQVGLTCSATRSRNSAWAVVSSCGSPRVWAASNRLIAGARCRLSNSGDVAGPAGGQMSGFSASARACSTLSPSGGAIQAMREARFWSSSVLWPVAQCSLSIAVTGSSMEVPAISAVSTRNVSHMPNSGTTSGTA